MYIKTKENCHDLLMKSVKNCTFKFLERLLWDILLHKEYCGLEEQKELARDIWQAVLLLVFID